MKKIKQVVLSALFLSGVIDMRIQSTDISGRIADVALITTGLVCSYMVYNICYKNSISHTNLEISKDTKPVTDLQQIVTDQSGEKRDEKSPTTCQDKEFTECTGLCWPHKSERQVAMEDRRARNMDVAIEAPYI